MTQLVPPKVILILSLSSWSRSRMPEIVVRECVVLGPSRPRGKFRRWKNTRSLPRKLRSPITTKNTLRYKILVHATFLPHRVEYHVASTTTWPLIPHGLSPHTLGWAVTWVFRHVFAINHCLRLHCRPYYAWWMDKILTNNIRRDILLPTLGLCLLSSRLPCFRKRPNCIRRMYRSVDIQLVGLSSDMLHRQRCYTVTTHTLYRPPKAIHLHFTMTMTVCHRLSIRSFNRSRVFVVKVPQLENFYNNIFADTKQQYVNDNANTLYHLLYHLLSAYPCEDEVGRLCPSHSRHSRAALFSRPRDTQNTDLPGLVD